MSLSKYDRIKMAKLKDRGLAANEDIAQEQEQESEQSAMLIPVTSSTLDPTEDSEVEQDNLLSPIVTYAYLDSTYNEMARLEGPQLVGKAPGKAPGVESSPGCPTVQRAGKIHASSDTSRSSRSPSPTLLVSTYDRLKAAGLTKSQPRASGVAPQSPTPGTTLVSTYDRLKRAGLTKKKPHGYGTCKTYKPSSDDNFGASNFIPNKSFKKFPDLPKEVRLLIWEEVIPCRVINLEDSVPMVERARMVNRRIKDQAGQDIYISRSRLPDILFTCREAFAAMWKHYTLTFSSSGIYNPKTYFNYERDILYVNPRLKFASEIREEERCMVQRLALFIPPHSVSAPRLVNDALEEFRSLKTLTLVLDHYVPDTSESRRDDLMFINGLKGISHKVVLRYFVPHINVGRGNLGNVLNLDIKNIEARRQRSIKDTGKPLKMPLFDYKVAISASFKRSLGC